MPTSTVDLIAGYRNSLLGITLNSEPKLWIGENDSEFASGDFIMENIWKGSEPGMALQWRLATSRHNFLSPQKFMGA